MNCAQATQIVRAISDRTGVPFAEIVGEDRHRPTVRARQEAYVALHTAGASLSLTGRLMQRHHTTIMDGIRKAMLRQERAAA